MSRPSSLLHAITDDAPRLETGLCVGDAPHWDGDDPTTVDQVVWLCEQCSVLSACRSWLHSLPAGKRPVGVVAGEVVRDSGSIRKAKRHAN
jgi:WhiB family transcriptional regulator, redox-sensing transcriptional regulator